MKSKANKIINNYEFFKDLTSLINKKLVKLRNVITLNLVLYTIFINIAINLMYILKPKYNNAIIIISLLYTTLIIKKISMLIIEIHTLFITYILKSTKQNSRNLEEVLKLKEDLNKIKNEI